ncbi:MAG TPA: serpin family protein [Chthoniobacteraceae bacterium]|nr:serpin family protein [Chthoniobacteraceae bacterium]
MKTSLLLMTLAAFGAAQLPHLHGADNTGAASTAINSLGIDLLGKTGQPGDNALLSPYSIQEALAMTYAGAAGKTHDEMQKVLHFPNDDAALNQSFAALDKGLAAIEKSTAQIADSSKRGGPKEPITLAVANRLYGQQGYDFRKDYLETVKANFGAPLEQLDFEHEAAQATKTINTWVSGQTHDRIQNLIPDGALTKDTRLVLVNAIYLKAAWQEEFGAGGTQPAAFHVKGGEGADVPTMNHKMRYGYAKKEGYTAVSLPYIGSDLQFVILLPDDANGLPALEAKLTPGMLADCAKLEPAEVNLWLPKFKMEPPVMALSEQLKALGMATAFDVPHGSANFDGIAPRKPDDYLFISEVFHKTFLSLDEHGTEAAAATAVVMMRAMAIMQEPEAKEVHVDHPFLFAIQDRNSGACLFLGRMNDPR